MVITECKEQGYSSVVECKTCDGNATGSIPRRSGRGIFLSTVNCLCRLSFQYPFQPCSMLKRPQSFCQLLKQQITAQHACSLDSVKSEQAAQPLCWNPSGKTSSCSNSWGRAGMQVHSHLGSLSHCGLVLGQLGQHHFGDGDDVHFCSSWFR